MKTSSQWLERSIIAILPIAFFGSGFLNMITFVFGLHAWDTVRTIVTFGILGAVALILFYRVVWLYVQVPSLRKPVCFMSSILIVFCTVHLWALIVQADKGVILKNAIVNGCYLLSSWSAFILLTAEDHMQSFLRACRIYALILAPIVLYYCIRFYLPGADYTTRNLGALTYMPFAYTLLTANVFLLLEILLYDIHQKSPAQFFWINLIVFSLFSIAIALSGTKGAIACLLFDSIIFALYLIKQAHTGIYSQFSRVFLWLLFPFFSSRTLL